MGIDTLIGGPLTGAYRHTYRHVVLQLQVCIGVNGKVNVWGCYFGSMTIRGPSESFKRFGDLDDSCLAENTATGDYVAIDTGVIDKMNSQIEDARG